MAKLNAKTFTHSLTTSKYVPTAKQDPNAREVKN